MRSNPMTNGPFVIKSSVRVYSSPWLDVREDAVTRPGGSDGRFAVVTMRPGSTVIALDADDSVLVAREFKYAVARETIELISGGLDEGETPLDAARRELQEEAGVTAQRWTPLGIVDPFTISISSPNHVFLAQDLQRSTSNLDDGEVVAIERVPFDEAIAMVARSEITHAASCVAILATARLLGR